jgi:sugar phosphate isomerase/epimerase
MLAAGYASALAPELAAKPLGLPIGFQTYPIAKAFAQDVDGVLAQMAKIGYQDAEMCSPPSYKALYEPLLKMPGKELAQHFRKAGITCHSCHFGFAELKQNAAERIEWAKGLGLKQMVISSWGTAIPKGGTMDDWRRAADETNKIGEQTRKAGLPLGYHNHGMEVAKIDGVLIYDELMKRLDPKLVRMQCQVANVVGAGLDPVAFLKKYPGRFISLHLADKPSVGKGTIDWKSVFAAAKVGGIKNYYVEMGMQPLIDSYPYLRDLKV